MMNPMNTFDFYPRNQSKKIRKALEVHFRKEAFHHEEMEQYDCGLIINPNIPYFAASPDHLITCDCHGEGCIVVKFFKCMESAETFEVLTREPNCILNINENGYSLEKTHDLYFQLQLHINVVELSYCDLIIWSPKPNVDHLIIRVDADIDFWRSNMQKALKFHEQVMMPEILGKKFTKIDRVNYEADTMVQLEIELLSRDEEDVLACEIPDFLYKTEEKKETALRKELNLDNNIDNTQEYDDSISEVHDITVRNLMKDSIDEILKTYSDHEDQLKRIYGEQIKRFKRSYRPKDIPPYIALDIVNEAQLQAMATFAEMQLAQNLEEETNSSDVIFDAIIPESALAVFCKRFNYTKSDAIEVLRMQAQALAVANFN